MGNELGKDNHKYDGHNHRLDTTSQHRICNNRQRFIRDHVRNQQRRKKQVTILTNRGNLAGIRALFSASLCHKYLQLRLIK